MKSIQHNRVLIVSGNPRALAEIKKGLMDNFETNIAATESTALTALETYGADAVVIFLENAYGVSPSAFSLLSDYTVKRGLPLLFLAERDDEIDESAAFSVGAVDYAVKRAGFDSLIERLKLRIATGNCHRQCQNDTTTATLLNPAAILNGKTILIAEDVELNRDVIAVMLSDIAGLTIDFAANGYEAIDLFNRSPERYAIIFMDIQMPELDGLSATRAIRKLNGDIARKIPIIALTASMMEDDASEFMAAGMNDYLEKPMNPTEFVDICVKYLTKNELVSTY
ncbi:MAG: response regulator [Lachnospiraceae bacterium]|nr:response regulator [Lachnospiraceae bacterium]